MRPVQPLPDQVTLSKETFVSLLGNVMREAQEVREIEKESIFEFFRLYGLLEQALDVSDKGTQEPIKNAMTRLIQNDNDFEKFRLYRRPDHEDDPQCPLPLYVRNVLCHSGTNPLNPLIEADVKEAVKLLNTWARRIERLNNLSSGIDKTTVTPSPPDKMEHADTIPLTKNSKEVAQAAQYQVSQLGADRHQPLPTVEHVPFGVSLSDGIGTIETVGLRLLDLFRAEPTDKGRREMMYQWINFLYWRDLYPKKEIEDLHDLRTPAELVWATVSLANPRIDDLMAMFPDLNGHHEPWQLVKKLIPSLETFLDI